MAELHDKVENALNEIRILILGGQVLIGFFFRAAFEKEFPKLSPRAQFLEVATLALMLVGLGVLIWPAAYHRIVERGAITASLHRSVSAALAIGLLPFAIAVGSFAYLACVRAYLPPVASILISTLLEALCLACWYLLELHARRLNSRSASLHDLLHPGGHKMRGPDERTGGKLGDRIKQVLTECRMVLPGAQALLGFQFITVFLESFEKLPPGLKRLHIASLLAVAICTILLVMPASYHRIVEEGDDSERIHDFAGRVLLWSMVFLALGFSGDFLLVLLVVFHHQALSFALASALLLFFYGLWFGATLYWRSRSA
ncbi:MAG: hypothetical protein JO041_13985 [Acidobacteria bacterium]|nr:hypothetical protein [Acidobacteriota bacterium]